MARVEKNRGVVDFKTDDAEVGDGLAAFNDLNN